MKTWLTRELRIPRWLLLVMLLLVIVICVTTEWMLFTLNVQVIECENCLPQCFGEDFELAKRPVDRHCFPISGMPRPLWMYWITLPATPVAVICLLGIFIAVRWVLRRRIAIDSKTSSSV